MKKKLLSVLAFGVVLLAFTSCSSDELKPNWASDVTAEQKAVLQELIDNMVYVEGGTFTMGATSEQGDDAVSDEYPTHHVTLSDYMIGKTEVTQAQWKAVMGGNPSEYTGGNRPVDNVSWYDCQDFIEELNRLTGLNFRLPTEAEWEYAARGGNKSQGYKYSGSDIIDDVAWYRGNTIATQEVGTKKANELGLYDMSGNLFEWCSDWDGDYSAGSQTNPQGPSECWDYRPNRVLRGGGWDFYAVYCRVSSRFCCRPDSRVSYGFRLCIEQASDSQENSETSELQPNWASDVTAEQKAVLQKLIDNMAYVEGGTFTMGATSEQDDDARDDEFPEHQVTLSDYMIAKTEVTQKQWNAVMGDTQSGENRPLRGIWWESCQKFIKNLSRSSIA